ncbi:hypothetical protein NDA11_002487 [Ustilago hordei]|uniref:Related to nuclear GTPase n=1 Tax=Ustilago hordei TaxID=120017 RepID=I2G5A2_USTHO|nr:uncharacterized protein UHO2_01686 [Ustilago hordei]KAJ1039460.1 hypothetical protein NDA10_000908 [Ustilago hordei]KAJ1585622.1 hypothetical protein NDA12_000146 [Ustilago hordei]KAJ1588965.1 hypothetical protein NDA15_001010 [Ustilago hordei]KAJ1590767.1 hypothetical protein NDA11_002487 [Ustilago hordei]CCF54345.1 related to nuclear GTPase [Ustilago hordei]
MVKVKKRASKRLKLAQREKVKKKVKEHRRKTRRDERRSTQWKSKAKKDPGIPNSFPYKEQLLNEIEQKRRIQEEEKLARKAEKLAERNGKNTAEQEGGSDVEGVAEDEEVDADDVLDNMPLTAPLFRGTLADVLESTDIKTVVLTLDARDPQSFRSPWLEAKISSRKDKEFAFALSRSDMVPLEMVAAWSAYLSNTTGFPVFPISSPSDQLAENTGAEALVEQLDLKGVKKGDVAVVGLTHSGRSTVADAILNAIGVPKDEDVEDEDNETSDWPAVLDTPALIPLKSSEAAEDSDVEEEDEDDEDESEKEEKDEHKYMARMELKSMQTLMRNQGHVQRIKEPLALTWALLSRVSHPEDLMLIYNVPAFGSFQPGKASLADEELDAEEKEKIKAASRRRKVHADTQEFLIALARATGRMKKRNIPDEIGASRVLLRDWSDQMLGYYTQAPKLAAEAQKLSDEIKQRVSSTMPLVLPRKEWRKKFQARELRLKPISLVLGREALVQDQVEMMPPPPEDDDSEEDDSEEDEDEIDEALLEDGDDEEEEDEEAEIAPKKQLKSILKKGGSKKRDQAEDDDEDDVDVDDDEEAQQLSRKERRVQKKARVVVPSKSKPAAKRNGTKATPKSVAAATATATAAAAAKVASAASGPAPGEKFDFGML